MVPRVFIQILRTGFFWKELRVSDSLPLYHAVLVNLQQAVLQEVFLAVKRAEQSLLCLKLLTNVRQNLTLEYDVQLQCAHLYHNIIARNGLYNDMPSITRRESTSRRETPNR